MTFTNTNTYCYIYTYYNNNFYHKKIQLRFVTFVWWPQQRLCFFSTKNNNERGLRLSQAPGMFFFLYFFYFSLTTNDYFIDALASRLPILPSSLQTRKQGTRGASKHVLSLPPSPSFLPTFKWEDEGLRGQWGQKWAKTTRQTRCLGLMYVFFTCFSLLTNVL